MPTSPKKSPKKSTVNVKYTTATAVDYENVITEQVHSSQMVVSEKEIEIERLKTTVESLNYKCSIVDDHVEDVKSA